MIDSTAKMPRPKPRDSSAVDIAYVTPMTPTLIDRNATIRSRRRWRGKYSAKTMRPMATRSAAMKAKTDMGVL